MEGSANVIARVDPELKTQADAIMERNELTPDDVINMLYGWIVLQDDVPKEVRPLRRHPVMLEGMPIEDRDAEFERAQQSVLAARSTPAERAHARLRRDFHM